MRVPPVNPASELANVQALAERVRQLEATVLGLITRRATYAQRGTVTAFVGGSTTATVQLTNGATVTARYLQNAYTPVVGHKVFVIFGPEGVLIDGRDSVP
jgi:hypothetical protein